MILPDTSVWIRALRGRLAGEDVLARLAESGEVVGHDLIHDELLIGDIGVRGSFLAIYALFVRAPMIAHADVAALVRARRLAGRGIGWIDAHLLASALAGRHRLWTADDRLAKLADELGVGWTPR